MARLSLVVIMLFSFFGSFGQEVKINAFQHYIRWVNEISLPRYITEGWIQDSILEHTSILLGSKFKSDSVVKPKAIEVDYIEMFGKPKMKGMAPAVPGQIQVNILSFMTRATTGLGVNWSMEIIANQDGKTIFQKKVPHEIEYFSPSGYMSSTIWYSPENFLKLYKALLDELLTDTVTLPAKIIIGSIKEKEELISRSIPGARKALMTGRGNFLGGGNFTMALSEGADTVSRVRYRNGWDSYRESGPPGIGAQIFKAFTGVDVATNIKVKITYNGKITYDDGREIYLKLRYYTTGLRWTDGEREYSFSSTPAVVDAYAKDVNVASMVYMNYEYKVPQVSLAQQNFQSIPVGHSVRGRIGEDTVYAEFDPEENIISVYENKVAKVAVLLENVKEGGRSYSGQKLSKNKVTVTPEINFGKSKGDFDESYNFYYSPDLQRERLDKFMDVILVLFFCKGNVVPFN